MSILVFQPPVLGLGCLLLGREEQPFRVGTISLSSFRAHSDEYLPIATLIRSHRAAPDKKDFVMPNAVRCVSFFLSLSLCSLLPLAHADMYKCKNAQGSVTFSGTPCAVDATKIASPTATNVSSSAPSSTAPTSSSTLVGKWRTGYGMTYDFKADGSLRSDEVHRDFSIWRTGRWKLAGKHLVMTFTKIGGAIRNDSFNGEEAGDIEWEDEMRIFRMNHDTYIRVN